MRCLILVSIALALACTKKEQGSAANDVGVAETAETPPQTKDPEKSGQVGGSHEDLGSPTIELLDSGTEPRRMLRSSMVMPAKQRLKIRVDNEMEGLIGAFQAKQAPRSVTLELVVRPGQEGGDQGQALSFTVAQAEMDRISGLPPHALESRREALAALPRLTGTCSLDAVGGVQDVVVNLPPGASSDLSGVAEDIKWGLRELVVPFPEEPVGKGATWTVSHNVVQDGVQATETSSFEITKMDKRLVTVRRQDRQSASPQKFQNPGSTVDIDLTDFSGGGTGEVTWNSLKRFPRDANVSSTVIKHTTFESEGKHVTGMLTTRRTLTHADKP
jgi:hypothetical protein